MKYADMLRAEAAKLDEARTALVGPLDLERSAIIAEIEALATACETEKRTATAAEDTILGTLTERGKVIVAEIAERTKDLTADIAGKIARADELDALSKERTEVPKSPQFLNPGPKADATDTRSMSNHQVADVVARSIEGWDGDPEGARAIMKRHARDTRPENRQWFQGVAARSTEIYGSAWAKYITGRSEIMTAEERAAMQVGSNAAGGYLVPTHLDPTIILTNAGSSNALRAISRVVTLTVGNKWNGITSAGVTASWDGELTEVSDDTPNDFGHPGVPTYMMRAFAQASYESFEDIDNLGPDLLMMLADARDRLEGTAHATGGGSTLPRGIFTALAANTNVLVVSTTGATVGLVDLQALKRKVGVRFRNAGTWVMNPVYADAIKGLGTAISASFSTNITEANAERLLGKPVVETDDAPSTQTTTAKDPEIIYGDFSNYLIVDKPGSTALEFIPNLFNTTTNLPDGRRGWLMHTRQGADSINDVAFALLQDKTTA